MDNPLVLKTRSTDGAEVAGMQDFLKTVRSNQQIPFSI